MTTARRRTRGSAKAAGSRFERIIADYLAQTVDDRIDRRVKTGARDCGDIGGVRLGPHRLVIECKDTAKVDLPQWTREAQSEAMNDGAAVGVVVHKRHGQSFPGAQWVSMTVDDLVTILAAYSAVSGPTPQRPDGLLARPEPSAGADECERSECEAEQGTPGTGTGVVETSTTSLKAQVN